MAKKKKILEAVKKIIVEKGVRKITTEAIAKKAGIAKGTLYLYFRCKEDIFAGLLNSFLDEAENFVAEAKKSKGSGLKKLMAFIKSDLRFYEKNHKLFRVLGMEMDSVANIMSKKYKEKQIVRYFKIIRSIEDIIEQAIKERELGKMSAMEGAVILISIIHGYAGMRVHKLSRVPLTRQSDRVLNMFLNGAGKC
ncbi:MAG: TetR/AcrR family transcriptional regulator [bacterium]